MKGYIALGVSIISEIFGTTMLKLSEGFTNLYPSFGVILGFGLAFYCLSLCLKTIPLSLAYAIWSGIGTALTALIGVLLWNEPFNLITLGGLVLIIGGVVLLNGSHTPKQVGESSI
ncbi:Multidrug resistance protein EbrB [Peribacillus sp. Bi96]|uniref:DMT family transporter n=1 Tax=Peribacillus sp. Bi96 TaxID=2884273 RepID=UPI001DB5DCA8|nr:multidrug efflux SMR transporter [Peribacillus sp. Bi96]CAH0266157.1 Multidrug resistance protein EbrB [Peribacillus sp. Bi96]